VPNRFRSPLLAASAALVLAVAGCGRGPATPPAATVAPKAGQVDAARLAAAANEPGQWFTGGRDGAGTYYSPLARIDRGNVGRLGLAWQFLLETNRGLEATPLVIDGVMYAVGNWGRVYALDARTGQERWRFVPPVDGQWGRHACCDVVNRGLAVWAGRVYVGATDGWLYALDAADGRVVWKADTLLGRDRHVPYTITGAPLIAGDKVVIGNGGADFGVRGYVTAYDLATGTMKWRFFTVPRDPALGPQDQPHLEAAAATWDPKSQWSAGGGGTVWDGMAYDPALDLVYLGTGNASPYDQRVRSPRGGDNLYLASIVAVKGGDGTLAWHYQQVPGERWDYTSTAKMILADLELGGRTRHVLMQAPKDGFFYVLDRATGELLSAKNYTFVNWTKGIDPKTGRPIPNPAAEYATGPKLVYPSQAGGHNWHPMSYSPQTGLVYIPAIDAPMIYVDTSKRPVGEVQGAFTVPGLFPEGYDPKALAPLFGAMPSLDELAARAGGPRPPQSRGELRAWDPVQGKVVWSVPGASFWDGGVLSTGGGLVFRGDTAGAFLVYDAKDGALLKRIETGSSILAAPMSYEIDGTQYVAVMAGYGGGGGGAFPPGSAAWTYGNQGRILVFRLDGAPVPLPAKVVDPPFPAPPPSTASAADVARGAVLYNRYCGRCHAFGRGYIPDLRRMSAATHENFYRIVLEGAYVPKGMARWDDVLSHADAEAIYAYLVSETATAYAAQQTAATPR
jgi:quinohemoprotein ethanol dehydrogenase